MNIYILNKRGTKNFEDALYIINLDRYVKKSNEQAFTVSKRVLVLRTEVLIAILLERYVLLLIAIGIGRAQAYVVFTVG